MILDPRDGVGGPLRLVKAEHDCSAYERRLKEKRSMIEPHASDAR
jgi:hypothetical protein